MPVRRRKEPRWITRAALSAIHAAQLREHGGKAGVRDANLIEAALARPRQKWNYNPDTDIAMLAAAYSFGLAKNHGFIDGNKRVAFMAAYSFLGLNGFDFYASEADVVEKIERLAAGKVSERQLAEWFQRGLRPD
ncbi:MAG TPA: type II toxin-antitoxin system death-on-curing family toxin [Gemmatimonadaceae bacterium]